MASAPEEYLDDALEAIGMNSQGTLFAPARQDLKSKSIVFKKYGKCLFFMFVFRESSGGGGGNSRDSISDLFRGRLGIDLGADTRLKDFEQLLKP